MKHVDLFTGYGGFALAFQHHGFCTVAFAEIEPFCSKVLKAHWPDIPNLGDVRGIDGHRIRAEHGDITVVTFGSPCQDWSVAGKRAGISGERSGLFFEAVRIVRDLRPAFAVFENVPGLFSQNDGWDFAAVLDSLALCGALDIAWRVLDAQYAGVPQRRDRVFVVADFRGERAGEILSLTEGVRGHSETSGEAGEDATAAVASSLGSRGNRSHTELDGHGAYVIKGAAIGRKPEAGPQYGEVLNDGTCYTLNATEQHVIAAPLTANYGKQPDNSDATAPNLVPIAFNWQEGHNFRSSSSSSSSSSSNPLRANQTEAVAFHENQRAETTLNDTAGSLKVGGGKPGQGYPAAQIGMQVRRLTPRECERLMGLPDDWTAIPGAADGPRYRALGNGVVVPVVKQIAERMWKAT